MWRSRRFKKEVVITRHASLRAIERDISDEVLCELLETGAYAKARKNHFWIHGSFSGRKDNPLCVACCHEKDVLIIKTVMVKWELENNGN